MYYCRSVPEDVVFEQMWLLMAWSLKTGTTVAAQNCGTNGVVVKRFECNCFK